MSGRDFEESGEFEVEIDFEDVADDDAIHAARDDRDEARAWSDFASDDLDDDGMLYEPASLGVRGRA